MQNFPFYDEYFGSFLVFLFLLCANEGRNVYNRIAKSIGCYLRSYILDRLYTKYAIYEPRVRLKISTEGGSPGSNLIYRW